MAVIRLTRPLGMLFATFCALAARAAAGPVDELARPAPEIEGTSAPAAEGTGDADAARLSEAPHAPDQGAKSGVGNPLWTVPLSALSATRDQPLFSASRRPPIVAVPMVAAAPKQEAVAPPPPERPLLTLIGTIVSRGASLAMLQGSSSEAVSRLRIGEENDGWRVRRIDLRSIVVEKGAQSVKLDLPRPDGAPPSERRRE
jgi:general secretion pathway protein N